MEGLRLNTVRTPKSLTRRHLPPIDTESIRRAAVTTRAFEATVKRPVPEQPRIVSSAHGTIRHVLLCYPSYAGGDDVYRDVFVDLFRQLPEAVELTVVAHSSVVADIEKAADTERPRSQTTIVEAPNYLRFSVWAEDPYVVVEDVGSDPSRRSSSSSRSRSRAAGTASWRTSSRRRRRAVHAVATLLPGREHPHRRRFRADRGRLSLRDARHVHPQQPVIGMPEDNSKAQDFIVDLFQQTFDPDRKIFFAGTRLRVPATERHEVRIDGEKWTEGLYEGTGHPSRSSTSTCS